MSTTLRIDNINQSLEENRTMVGVTSSPTCMYILHLIRSRQGITLDQINTEFTFRHGTAEDWLRHILEVGLAEPKDSKYYLTPLGVRRLALTDISLKELGGTEIPGTDDVPNKLPGSYRLDPIPLGEGATSVTFRAIQLNTDLERTVKVFRPGIMSYDQLESFKQKRATIPKEVAIPDFIGMGQFCVDLESHGELVVLDCQVFDYVNGDAKTLQEYVVNTDPAPYLSSDFFRFFVEHVGGALEAIERAGLQHGDLHARNILVIQREGREPAISFKVIDFAGGSSFSSLTFSGVNDLEMFKRHLIWCFSEVCCQRPGVSARELVGDKVERVIIGLREQKYENFAELLYDFHKHAISIPPDYFQEPTPRPFEWWLRIEMMPSLKELYLLFEPDESVFEAISGSDNVIISGHRGCGKSHYLRSLNFWPKILKLAEECEELKTKLELIGYDFRRFFGVLFECRVGEFKNFTPEAVDGKKFTAETVRVLKHILVLKIINKTFSVLREGCEYEVLIHPQNISALRNFIKERFPYMPLYGEPNAVEEITQYARALVTKEKQAESTWNLPDENRGLLLAEPDVEAFFESLQKDFPDLARTQFFILVDDISEGRMHPEMQKVLNSIMTSATKRFCFKITSDKFMYTLDTTEGRAIDPSQDVVYVDLGDLSVKAQRPRKAIREYVRGIVNARLNAWIPQKSDIVTILGKSQEPKDFLRLLRRPRKETRQTTDAIQKDSTRSKALYAGWNIVWQLSHGSIRTLFQLLDHIFAQSNFDIDNPEPIHLDSQDKYVREFSTQKFQSLLMLKGSIGGDPLGTPLSDVARSMGEVSRSYLRKYDTGELGRFYETITLERLDLKPLGKRAAQVLKYLAVYDILMTKGITFSRAQVGLSERYDLNKIYAPSFETTYRVRNHLFLSKDKLEELLLKPDEFVKKTRARLDDLVKPERQIQIPLFDED